MHAIVVYHTISSPPQALPGNTDISPARFELTESKRILEEITGKRVDLLAWSYGDCNARLEQLSKKCGFAPPSRFGTAGTRRIRAGACRLAVTVICRVLSRKFLRFIFQSSKGFDRPFSVYRINFKAL